MNFPAELECFKGHFPSYPIFLVWRRWFVQHFFPSNLNADLEWCNGFEQLISRSHPNPICCCGSAVCSARTGFELTHATAQSASAPHPDAAVVQQVHNAPSRCPAQRQDFRVFGWGVPAWQTAAGSHSRCCARPACSLHGSTRRRRPPCQYSKGAQGQPRQRIEPMQADDGARNSGFTSGSRRRMWVRSCSSTACRAGPCRLSGR